MTCQLQTLLHALQADLAPIEAPRKQKWHKLPVEAPRKQKCHKLAFSKQATLSGLPTWKTHDWWSLYVNKRVIDWSHCPCISLPLTKKRRKRECQHGRPMTGLPHPFTSPPTSLSYCLGLVVGVRVFDCLYMVAVVSTMSKYI